MYLKVKSLVNGSPHQHIHIILLCTSANVFCFHNQLKFNLARRVMKVLAIHLIPGHPVEYDGAVDSKCGQQTLKALRSTNIKITQHFK